MLPSKPINDWWCMDWIHSYGQILQWVVVWEEQEKFYQKFWWEILFFSVYSKCNISKLRSWGLAFPSHSTLHCKKSQCNHGRVIALWANISFMANRSWVCRSTIQIQASQHFQTFGPCLCLLMGYWIRISELMLCMTQQQEGIQLYELHFRFKGI